MKRILLIGCLVLAGCATVPNSADISTKAKEIQGYTKLACSFVPTIQTIVSIINAGAGAAISIANDICAAVTTAPLADGGPRQAKVNGVVVRGRFVK